jgi:hypothetical protein
MSEAERAADAQRWRAHHPVIGQTAPLSDEVAEALVDYALRVPGGAPDDLTADMGLFPYVHDGGA